MTYVPQMCFSYDETRVHDTDILLHLLTHADLTLIPDTSEYRLFHRVRFEMLRADCGTTLRNARGLRTCYLLADPPCVHHKGLT